MIRFALTLVVGLLVSLGTMVSGVIGEASATAISPNAMVCEKYTGFKDYPQRVVFTEDELKLFKLKHFFRHGQSKSLYYERERRDSSGSGNYQLLPNGRMIKGDDSRYARYKCSHTVDEVLARQSTQTASAPTPKAEQKRERSSVLDKIFGILKPEDKTSDESSPYSPDKLTKNVINKNDGVVCSKATHHKTIKRILADGTPDFSEKELQFVLNISDWWTQFYVFEAKRRGLSCGVTSKNHSESIFRHSSRLKHPSGKTYLAALSDKILCESSTSDNLWNTVSVGNFPAKPFVEEAKRRGLSCGVGESGSTQVATASTNASSLPACPSSKDAIRHNCFGTYTYASGNKYVGEFKDNASHGQGILTFADGRAAKEGVWKYNAFQYAKKLTPSGSDTQVASSTNTQANTATSAELLAAQRKAEELEQRLADLEAQQQQQQQTISSDTQVPLITITSASSNGPKGTINGRVTDNTGVGEVRVDGQLVAVDSNGIFTANTYVPEGGVSVTVEAFDLAGLSSSMSVQLDRVVTQTATITFDRLNPLGKQVKSNKDALALIVGVADYENTPAKAIFADSDALTFRDYASEKLGIPENRIKTLVDDGADIREVLLGVKQWLSRAVKQDQSDVYVFFAGHGLASDDGSQMYLLPYDGAPELLEETTISREKLFTEVAAANPRSVTVFLDTCYSGQTRNEEMLIASRPLVLVPKQQSIPDNFTVMTAAAGDQTAKPLEEAKHGMFSYFLMKGMEGEADTNQDNSITAGELHSYVQTNVMQQSSGSQTPELQGDADRVLVQFQ